MDVYIFYQPQLEQSSSANRLATEALDSATQALSAILNNASSSPWVKLDDRVRKTSLPLASSSNEDLYNIRRRGEVEKIETSYSVDVVILPQQPGAGKRAVRLAVFDMDSTLIEQEVIDELARSIGKYQQVAAITERAMRGELDFAGSLRERVALLRGLDHNVWDQIRPRISFASGARELCAELKEQGVRMAVLSGGFTPLAEWVKGELGLDVAHANFLQQAQPTEEFPFVHLSGRLVDGKPIVTAERKRELLLQIASEQNIPLSEVLCIGDGANDLKMLSIVGQGGGVAIALKAKPKVQHEAPNKLNSRSMTDVLYLLNN